MMGFRLRQVAIVGNEYEETEEALKSLLDLDVASVSYTHLTLPTILLV